MPKKVRSFSISNDLKEKLKEISQKENRSLSNTVVNIIDRYLKENGCK